MSVPPSFLPAYCAALRARLGKTSTASCKFGPLFLHIILQTAQTESTIVGRNLPTLAGTSRPGRWLIPVRPPGENFMHIFAHRILWVGAAAVAVALPAQAQFQPAPGF